MYWADFLLQENFKFLQDLIVWQSLSFVSLQHCMFKWEYFFHAITERQVKTTALSEIKQAVSKVL